jgi:hypothetical protein
MRKRFFGLTLSPLPFALGLVIALLLALSVPAEARQPGEVPRIGYLSNMIKPTPATLDRFEDAFRQGLSDLGYIEGKNILIEFRYAEGRQNVCRTSLPNSCESRSM